LSSQQFGLSEAELLVPIGELSNFKISWYLFDMQPFKGFVGVSQMLCGVLLLWNRSVIIGALLFLPIALNILVIDLSFMPEKMANAFVWRLSYYILLDLLILWFYRERMLEVWNSLIRIGKRSSNLSVWLYLSLPLAAILLEIISPKFIYQLITNPTDLFKGIKELSVQLLNHLFA